MNTEITNFDTVYCAVSIAVVAVWLIFLFRSEFKKSSNKNNSPIKNTFKK